MTVLFVTWDGARTNYLESLFLPILARLDQPACVLQFTSADSEECAAREREAARLGVGYRHVTVSARMGAGARTWLGLPMAARELKREIARTEASIVMPRSVVPGAMTLLVRRDCRKLIYEADGLMADERVDFAGWPSTGARYRFARDLEAQLVRRADLVLTRTERARRVLLARAGAGMLAEHIRVIPNGKDERAFRPPSEAERARVREALGVVDSAPLLVYAGSIGPQYHPGWMAQLFVSVVRRDPRARFLALTAHNAFRESFAEAGVPPDAVSVRRVPQSEVPGLLGAADVGIAFRTPSFSQAAVCPIKVAEYLLCGVPTLATRGVGDLDAQLDGERCVRLIDCESEVDASVDWIFDVAMAARTSLHQEARELGMRHFALSVTAQSYRQAIADL